MPAWLVVIFHLFVPQALCAHRPLRMVTLEPESSQELTGHRPDSTLALVVAPLNKPFRS
jgi:hypothetical protein